MSKNRINRLNIGFTLIESLIVIVAIGILSIIVFVGYSSFTKTAKTAAAQINASSVQKIADMYFNENKTYPGTIGKFLIVANAALPKKVSLAPDADDTILNDSNGLSVIAYACVNSCEDKIITGARLTYWDFVSKTPKYIYLGSAVATSYYDYPAALMSVYSGGDSNCGVADNGSTYCWGYSGDGQFANNIEGQESATYPGSIYTKGSLLNKKVKKISAGQYSMCAVTTDEKLYCWGDGIGGEIGDDEWNSTNTPSLVDDHGYFTGKSITSVGVGNSFACALISDGKVYCWGSNWTGQNGNGGTSPTGSPNPVKMDGVLNGKTVKSLSVGSTHVCVIASDNLPYCWGENSRGQLGNGSTTTSLVPVAVNNTIELSGKTIISISTGYRLTCAITSDNLSYCWGDNRYGQIGDNSTTQKTTPTAVYTAGALSGKTVKSISTGWLQTCAIASDNKVYCWGSNTSGELGIGTYSSPVITPSAVKSDGVLLGKTISQISVGNFHTCVLTSDSMAYCWGSNQRSAISQTRSMINSNIAIPVNTSGSIRRLNVISIETGFDTSCLIASDNNVYCWGSNSTGQLGNNQTSNRLTPSKSVSGDLSKTILKSITIGNATCATDQLGSPYCWGTNSYGQLGNGSYSDSFVPAAVNRSGVLLNKTIKKFAIGDQHTCSIASDDNAYCWGKNTNGELGDNTWISSSLPVPIYKSGSLFDKTILDITAGHSHTCVIASDNNGYCWGLNNHGQIGVGDLVSYKEPKAVFIGGELSGKTLKSIKAGRQHTCAIASDNYVYCWGSNGSGQLGNNSSADALTPTKIITNGVLNEKTSKQISSGDYHTCTIASDDKPYCWGAGWGGQLGNGTKVQDSMTPVATYTDGILLNEKIINISSGISHNCVITQSKRVACWGDNNFGQLGNNSKESSSIPLWSYM